MKTKTIFVCEKCLYESPDINEVHRCESRNHELVSNQFLPITKEIIESFRPRLEAIKKLDKKGYIDSPPTCLYHILYGTYLKGHYLTLNVALTELEKFYGINKEEKAKAEAVH